MREESANYTYSFARIEKLPKMQQEPANYTYSFARMWKLPKMQEEPATYLQNFAKLDKFMKREREREYRLQAKKILLKTCKKRGWFWPRTAKLKLVKQIERGM